MSPNAPVTKTEGSPAIRRLGRYTLRYRVAQGGMASVYLARMRSEASPAMGRFGRWVAVKTIHPHIADNPRFVTMFIDEARLAGRLDHPNLCSVFDCGNEGEVYYLAMEYLHGESLGVTARHAWGRAMPIAPELCARIVADAARGLHSAHELRDEEGILAGVVHRDVSPENIFVTYEGVVKVVDFGVARSRDQTDLTAAGELKGKLAYMAPELVREQSIDRRVDVWGLGVVLWEITVGRRLFRRESDSETLFAVMRDTVPPPTTLRADYPPALEAIVMRALERDTSLRYGTALELARALDAWIASTGLPAGPPEVAEFMQAWFADQKAFRDDILQRDRGDDAPVEDLVNAWQLPALPAPPEIPADYAEETGVGAELMITHPRTDRASATFLLTRHTARQRVVSDSEAEAVLLSRPVPPRPAHLKRTPHGARPEIHRSGTRTRQRMQWVGVVLLAVLALGVGILAVWWLTRPA